MSNQSPSPQAKKKNGGYFIANDKAHERQPDFRGKVDVEGREYLLSVWTKPPRDGKAFFTLELTDPSSLPARGGNAGGQGQSRSQGNASPAPSAPAPSDGESKALDDIFGGDANQW